MIYVVSDIHGHYDRFMKLLKKIDFKEEDILYILGDIIDRGPDVLKVIRQVMSMPNVRMILGNHEDMFLNAYINNSKSDKYLWYSNGGRVTDEDLASISKEEFISILRFFDKLPIEYHIVVNNQKYHLVHGNYVTKIEKKYFDDLDYRTQVIWGRIKKYDKGPNDEIVIFGHTGTYHYLGKDKPFKIWKSGNLIGIDCGLAAISRYDKKCQLGCICLNNLKEFYV